jgi:hypothetical protein
MSISEVYSSVEYLTLFNFWSICLLAVSSLRAFVTTTEVLDRVDAAVVAALVAPAFAWSMCSYTSNIAAAICSSNEWTMHFLIESMT